MIHKLKVDPDDYKLISKRTKNFEIRSADRTYRVGDTIVYSEFDGFEYTGKVVRKRITYVGTQEEGLKEGYVILSVETKIGRPKTPKKPGRKPRTRRKGVVNE